MALQLLGFLRRFVASVLEPILNFGKSILREETITKQRGDSLRDLVDIVFLINNNVDCALGGKFLNNRRGLMQVCDVSLLD